MKNNLKNEFIGMMERIVMYSTHMTRAFATSEYILQIRDCENDDMLKLKLKITANGEQSKRVECIGKNYPCNRIAYHEIYNKYFKARQYETYKFYCDSITSLPKMHYAFRKETVLKDNVTALNKFLNMELLRTL